MKKLFLLTILFLFHVGTVYPAPSKVSVVKAEDGGWELLVDGKPYFIKGVVYLPYKLGEEPGNATMRDWMFYDDNHNGKNDMAYDVWLDENKNNIKDPNEMPVGDFQLMKDLGVNTVRFYHLPSGNRSLGNIYKSNKGTALQYDHAPNKKLLREMSDKYGIKAIMGNFAGAWTIGSGASWEEGTDYNNPVHRENIKKSVKAMVLEHKNEPYVLFWAIGNENNMADWSKNNAKQYPEVYAKFVNELARMIHELDPNHPVAVIDGDDAFVTLRLYAKYGKDIDIIGYNTYRGKGLQIFFEGINEIIDKPIYVAETGRYAYGKNGEDEFIQNQYIKDSWEIIVANRHKTDTGSNIKSTGNIIGVTFFDWQDRWYMDGHPLEHNKGRRTWSGTNDIIHEEWFGILSLGDGSDYLKRQPRKAYYYLKEMWN